MKRAIVACVVLAALSALLCTAQPKDIEISLVTPFGSPLAAAKVVVKYPSGLVLALVSDSVGRIMIPRVPKEGVSLVVEEWRGFKLGYEVRRVASSGTIVVENIGKLRVAVMGARGQPLAGAEVEIKGYPIVGVTNEGGWFEVEVPAGTYTVVARYCGLKGFATITVPKGSIGSGKIRLDVFVVIASWPLTTAEFNGLVVLAVIVTITLLIVHHSIMRR